PCCGPSFLRRGPCNALQAFWAARHGGPSRRSSGWRLSGCPNGAEASPDPRRGARLRGTPRLARRPSLVKPLTEGLPPAGPAARAAQNSWPPHLDSRSSKFILTRCIAPHLGPDPRGGPGGMKNILVAEDDRSLREGLVQAMARCGYKVQVAQNGKEALEKIEKQVFDLVIAGHRIPGSDGLEILRKARSTNAGTMVIVTGENGTGAAEAMRSGAFDFVQKPLSLEAIEIKIQRAMEHQRLVVRLTSMTESQIDPSDRYGLVGGSSAMKEIFKVIDKVASSNATVLIQGETGTGKERVAEAIHRNSARRDGAFVRMNCASLPDNLLESELFGHEKGAFTGADQMRIGRFEMANDGTLFLDEVGNMSANTQAKVLRAIQNQE